MKTLPILAVLSGLLFVTGCSSPAVTQTESEPVETSPVVAAPVISSLNGTSWALVRLQGEALVLPPNGRRPFLSFGPDGRLNGYSGVNRLGGNPQIKGNSIIFGAVSSTRMAGPSAAMATESRLFECFRLTKTWRINGEKMELLDGESVLAIFNPIALDEVE